MNFCPGLEFAAILEDFIRCRRTQAIEKVHLLFTYKDNGGNSFNIYILKGISRITAILKDRGWVSLFSDEDGATMDHNSINRRGKLYEHISVVFIVSIFIISIALIIAIEKVGTPTWHSVAILTVIVGILAVFSVYLGPVILEHAVLVDKPNLFTNITTAIFFVIIALIIIATGGAISEIKILFFLPVMLYAGQHGRKYGLLLAGAISLFIFIFDFLYFDQIILSRELQIDIVVVFVLILFAWLLGELTDIQKAENKKMEAELARLDRMNLVGEMAASIGHEIRNPMTTVRGFLQVLQKNKKYADDREYFALMIEELDRANGIITEFLHLAKNKPINLMPQNLNNTINSLLPLIQSEATLANHHLKTELNEIPDFPMDEKEIRQLIFNLVRNGIEAMAAGKTLLIKTFMEDGKVVLAVKDEGSGIAPEILDKIGDPFFTTKDSGTGLGLSVCYNIAQRHNGSIDVDTGPAGTTFFVRFKL